MSGALAGIIGLLMAGISSCARVETPASRLTSVLFNSGYDRTTRPSTQVSQPIVVNINLRLYNIESLESKTQLLSVFAQVDLEWKDEFLSWDPADHGGITRLNVAADRLWLPDILFLDSADALYADVDLFAPSFPATLYANGGVVWSTAGRMTSLCELDMTYFPFDLQVCTMSFGSWVSSVSEIMYHVPEAHVDNETFFSSNREFKIVDTKAEVLIVPEKELGDTVLLCAAEFSISVRRRPLFYILNIFGPCILISVLTPFTFLLPTESGDRVSLSVTLLLAFTVYLLVLGETLPPGGQSVPLILLFILCCLALTSFALFIIILLGHLQSDRFSEPKGCVRSCVMRCLAPVFCHFKLFDYENERMIKKTGSSTESSRQTSRSGNENSNNANAHTHIVLDTQYKASSNKIQSGDSLVTDDEGDPEKMLVVKDSDTIQWVALTKVLDRFFFFLFIIIITIADFGFLVLFRASAP